MAIETLSRQRGSAAPVFRGRRSLWQMLDYLDQIEPDQTVSLAEGTKNFCLRNSGKGIVVLVSDLMDKQGYEAALRYLVSQEMDVYVVQVLSAEEIDPPLDGDLRLVDCEDGDVADITVSGPLLARYKKTLAALSESIREFCNRRGMVYLTASTELRLEELITGYLAKRGLVR